MFRANEPCGGTRKVDERFCMAGLAAAILHTAEHSGETGQHEAGIRMRSTVVDQTNPRVGPGTFRVLDSKRSCVATTTVTSRFSQEE